MVLLSIFKTFYRQPLTSMKSIFLCLFLLVIVYGCIEFNGDIPIQYRSQLNHYKLKDTLFYRSNLNDLDTLRITSIDSLSVKQGPDNFPFKMINLRVEHLPNNKWFDGIILSKKTNHYDSIKNQSFIRLTKEMMPNESIFRMDVTFRDFYGSIDLEKLEKTGKDTVKAKNNSLRDTLNSDSVIEVYWSKEKGMAGYKKKDGEVYKLK